MNVERVAYVLNIFPKLSETFIAGELAELRRRGVELRILSLQPPRAGLQHELVKGAGLDRLVCHEPEKFSAVVREFQPQLLHAHFAREATAEARRLGIQHALPFTFTAHGYDIHRKPPEDFAVRSAAARAVITVSEANANYIAATFGVPRAHLHVISCGVDTNVFCPALGAPASYRRVSCISIVDQAGETPALPGGCEAPWVVCVARHVAVKNLGRLLEACAELRRRRVQFRCVMVGDGPLRAELQTQRAALGLDKIVTMPGAAEQGGVLKWWQRASVGVLTSRNEGMPVSLMEAAACGVPVVAPAVGGIPELIQDGETGLLAKPDDLASLVAALERLLRDESLRARLGAAARQRALEQFSVRHQVDRLLALWERLLAGETAV